MTENFSASEFQCKCGCGYNRIEPCLVNRLQVIRDILQVPIVINSACRCTQHNTNVGGSPNSYHVQGLAVDFTCSKTEEAARLCENWSGGFKWYADRHCIHVDLGYRRRW